jgi:hypothetical protein
MENHSMLDAMVKHMSVYPVIKSTSNSPSAIEYHPIGFHVTNSMRANEPDLTINSE